MLKLRMWLKNSCQKREIKLSKQQAEVFYGVHSEKPFFQI